LPHHARRIECLFILKFPRDELINRLAGRGPVRRSTPE
jgi:hypothetical protein